MDSNIVDCHKRLEQTEAIINSTLSNTNTLIDQLIEENGSDKSGKRKARGKSGKRRK